MELKKKYDFYNPYHVDGRELKDIHLFDENGIVASVGRGWFGTLSKGGTDVHIDNRIPHIHLDGDVVYKRKFIPSMKVPFLIQIKSEVKNEKWAELYIPYNPDEWEVRECVMDDMVKTTMRYNIWIGKALSKAYSPIVAAFSTNPTFIPKKNNERIIGLLEDISEYVSTDYQCEESVLHIKDTVAMIRSCLDEIESITPDPIKR